MLEHAELENQDAHDRRKAMCPPTHLPPPHVIFSYSQTNNTQYFILISSFLKMLTIGMNDILSSRNMNFKQNSIRMTEYIN